MNFNGPCIKYVCSKIQIIYLPCTPLVRLSHTPWAYIHSVMTPPNIKKQQTTFIDRSSIWKLVIPFCHFISHCVFIGSEKIYNQNRIYAVDSVFDAFTTYIPCIMYIQINLPLPRNKVSTFWSTPLPHVCFCTDFGNHPSPIEAYVLYARPLTWLSESNLGWNATLSNIESRCLPIVLKFTQCPDGIL